MGVLRVDVNPTMLAWAADRSGRDPAYLHERFRLAEWEAGEVQPTLKQLEGFARATYTPVGALFLSEPPEEELPVPDFRTMPGARGERPSPNLLDTIYLCEQRQEWYREYARSIGEEPLAFVGSLGTRSSIEAAAETIRDAVGFDLKSRAEFPTWTDALRGLIARTEDAGVLVMVSGVVGNNTQRTLDPQEFRGFALADDLAPVVFINGVDSKAAQIFTLAHELAHIWLGRTGVSDARMEAIQVPDEVERWCNAVAAELLVPLASLKEQYESHARLNVELKRLARLYKVSTLVILRRVRDAGHLSNEEYNAAFTSELARVAAHAERTTSGGDFYNTQPARAGKRFSRAVVMDTLEGRTLRRDAFRLLGFKKQETFHKLSQRLGVA
jgi:Zn-dependent peptidase ImmA (M78 family)